MEICFLAPFQNVIDRFILIPRNFVHAPLSDLRVKLAIIRFILSYFMFFQCQSNLQLEDKCKWGECFIFVYDITDRYSFDEISRLKFMAYYTHSRLRLNFQPCWALIGNKKDLAENERMVTFEEGQKLSEDLSCDMFFEISVKEKWDDPKQVYFELWRSFSHKSPNSPSSSHRKKASNRVQDKIPAVNSKLSISLQEKTLSQKFLRNSTVTSLRRQLSGSLSGAQFMKAFDSRENDLNTFQPLEEESSSRFRSSKGISASATEIGEADETMEPCTPPTASRLRTRRAGIMGSLLPTTPLAPLGHEGLHSLRKHSLTSTLPEYGTSTLPAFSRSTSVTHKRSASTLSLNQCRSYPLTHNDHIDVVNGDLAPSSGGSSDNSLFDINDFSKPYDLNVDRLPATAKIA